MKLITRFLKLTRYVTQRIFAIIFVNIFFNFCSVQSYEYGQPQNLIYRVTGGSDDWAKGGAGIKWDSCILLLLLIYLFIIYSCLLSLLSRYVLLFELPGGVYGESCKIIRAVSLYLSLSGFMLPPRFIKPVRALLSAVFCLSLMFDCQVGSSIMSSVDAMARHIQAKRK